MNSHTPDTRVLLNEIEGHLMIAAVREEANTAAARFTARLDWLTEGQRAELEGRFEAEYLALARTSWRRTADRGRELRAEYEAMYRRLRQRLFAACVLGCALLVAASFVALSVT